jgi:hypothetical protein
MEGRETGPSDFWGGLLGPTEQPLILAGGGGQKPPRLPPPAGQNAPRPSDPKSQTPVPQQTPPSQTPFRSPFDPENVEYWRQRVPEWAHPLLDWLRPAEGERSSRRYSNNPVNRVAQLAEALDENPLERNRMHQYRHRRLVRWRRIAVSTRQICTTSCIDIFLTRSTRKTKEREFGFNRRSALINIDGKTWARSSISINQRLFFYDLPRTETDISR